MKSSLQRVHGLIQALPQGLQAHLARTREAALELAAHHGVAADRVELAGLGHDLARAHSDQALLEQARNLGLAIHPVEERVPILLHGPVAAELLKRECGVEDADVLEAVRWHSTGVPGMGAVGLTVFLADKLEHQKLLRTLREVAEGLYHKFVWMDSEKQRKVRLHEIAETARKSLEQAVADYLTMELSALLKRGSLLHPASVEARNDLLSRSFPPTARGDS